MKGLLLYINDTIFVYDSSLLCGSIFTLLFIGHLVIVVKITVVWFDHVMCLNLKCISVIIILYCYVFHISVLPA